MTAPHEWKHSVADVYASKYGTIAQEFLALVVTPSLDALERRWQEFDRGGDKLEEAFASLGHAELVNKTNSAFCLSIQALWERQLRGYLRLCPNAGIELEEVDKAKWGAQISRVFLQIRGLTLQSFDSYATLNKLNFLGNVCRHGDGKSADKLFKAHPELWPTWAHILGPADADATPPADLIKISRDMFTEFVNAIDVFWMDMERHGLESFGIGDEGVERRLAELRETRVPKLLTFKPEAA